MPEKVYCEKCRYLIPPHRPRPYSTETASNPEVLQHWAKWDQKLQEIEQAERERFQLGLAFTFKPVFYSRCKWWTDQGRKHWEKDQFGKPVVIYELAARHNANHDCPHFEEGAPEPD